MGKDVTIHVPAAVANMAAPGLRPPTPDEIIQQQAAQLRAMQSELDNQRVAASTIANVALALAGHLIQLGHGLDTDTVAVPFALRQRYDGGHLTITDSMDGAYLLKIRERGQPERLELAQE